MLSARLIELNDRLANPILSEADSDRDLHDIPWFGRQKIGVIYCCPRQVSEKLIVMNCILPVVVPANKELRQETTRDGRK
jgi:hypothetical protein